MGFDLNTIEQVLKAALIAAGVPALVVQQAEEAGMKMGELLAVIWGLGNTPAAPTVPVAALTSDFVQTVHLAKTSNQKIKAHRLGDGTILKGIDWTKLSGWIYTIFAGIYKLPPLPTAPTVPPVPPTA